MTTTDYIRHVKQSGWIPFNRRVWQRNYYERIIRDERQLEAIRRYILENPARWAGFSGAPTPRVGGRGHCALGISPPVVAAAEGYPPVRR